MGRWNIVAAHFLIRHVMVDMALGSGLFTPGGAALRRGQLAVAPLARFIHSWALHGSLPIHALLNNLGNNKN